MTVSENIRLHLHFFSNRSFDRETTLINLRLYLLYDHSFPAFFFPHNLTFHLIALPLIHLASEGLSTGFSRPPEGNDLLIACNLNLSNVSRLKKGNLGLSARPNCSEKGVSDGIMFGVMPN